MNKSTYLWNEFTASDIPINFVDRLKKEWMLVTAGTAEQLATMTINWGGNGFIWNQNVIFFVIRESRNTLPFLENSPSFTLSFFDDIWHDKLLFCGRNSGRNINKIEQCGFTPVFDTNQQAPYFEEANTVFFCKKIVNTQLPKDAFCDYAPSKIWETFYNTGVHTNDKHHLFIASVEKIIKKSQQ